MTKATGSLPGSCWTPVADDPARGRSGSGSSASASAVDQLLAQAAIA